MTQTPVTTWISEIESHASVGELVSALRAERRVVASGAWGSSATLTAGAVARESGRPVLLIVAHLDDADEAEEDLQLYGEGMDVAVFPALEVMPGESHVSLELLADRIEVISRLGRADQPTVIVAPVQALMQSVPDPREGGSGLDAIARELKPGMTLEQGGLVTWLADAGYERVEVVENPGEYAIRGGIVDIYPPGERAAVRVDFFGDEIENLFEIDLDSMGSTRRLDRVRILGTSPEKVQAREGTTTLFELIGAQTIVVLSEMLEIAEQARGYFERLTDARGIYSPPAVFQWVQRFAHLEVNQFAGRSSAAGEPVVALPVRGLPEFAQEGEKAVEELVELASGQSEYGAARVMVFCKNPAQQDRLRQLIAQHQPSPDGSDQRPGEIEIVQGYLYRGFIWGAEASETVEGRRIELVQGRAAETTRARPRPRRSGSSVVDGHGAGPLILVPHHELFHRYAARRRVRKVASQTGTESFFDIEVGEYVVHSDHGIARFRGLRMMKQKGRANEEYLTLEFADKALLHVPASEIEKVQKYIGGFAGRPPLSMLGGKRWAKQKESVREAVRDLAKELLRVQAARAAMPGIRYPADTPWMAQFEAEFPYDETEDQLAAIQALKKDMISERPMDRLICGDVGYGKTEVAMRAAFKAVEAGKQVAVLCPTTVLCEQHERTFRERMSDYPVRVESVSRFKTLGEAKQTLEAARKGAVDILIGTHRLLSEDVQFADLGLVIVDEEQRFGVEHKNKLMRYRVTVDVLTLSATPIPRTLHMALMGLRSISSLSTAPSDRRAIVTEVIPYDRGRIRQAILRELNRDGQVYYVHNRVHNIHQVANDLRTLVPEARFIVGHGQMKPRELEEVMHQFIAGQADVLISTTIIESGIDIASANTMFIADADRFGLAEMHQLRGRVGRYKHRAYCYLMLPEKRVINEVAAKRLRAIEEFAMLGAGFKIAMRDMEIRGVGNILGPEQSGHIATVGYDMYCRLLEEETTQLKREPAPHRPSVHLELGITVHLPQRYIPSDRHRIEAYRRIARAPDFAALDQVAKDLTDAYGPLPETAQRLLDLAEIRIGLSMLSVEALKLTPPDLVFATHQVKPVFALFEKTPGSVRLIDPPTSDRAGTIFWRPPEAYLDTGTLPAVLRKLIVRPLREQAAATSRSATTAGHRG